MRTRALREGKAALGGHGRARRARGLARGSCRRPTIASGRTSSRRRGRSRSRSGSSAAAHADEVDDVDLRRRRRRATRAGVLEALEDRGGDPPRPEQPVPLDRADPRRARIREALAVAPRPVRRREPARRRQGGHGPARPYALCAWPAARPQRTWPALYEGLIDALVIDEADAPAEAPVELVVASTLMRDRDRRAPARRARPGGGVRVAVVGGTGPFGTALAIRLRETRGLRGRDRLARRGARRRGRRRDRGRGARTTTPSARPISSCSPRRPTPCSRPLGPAGGDRGDAVLSVASELRVTPEGVFPCTDATSLAERDPGGARRSGRRGPALARRLEPGRRRAAGRGRVRLRRRRRCKGARARARRAGHRRARCRRGAARERPRPRGPDRGPRQREQALPRARGLKVTGLG